MIHDNLTNFLYLSDTLPIKLPVFYERLKIILEKAYIPFELLPGTKDIWARDYMPFQINDKTYVQFIYNPDYLDSNKWKKTISDTDAICEKLGIKPKKLNLKVDGGNIVKSGNKVIMCDKVFNENPGVPVKQLVSTLKDALYVDSIIFIPADPSDKIGHADGCVRFVNENCVLVNNYEKEKDWFRKGMFNSLLNAGLDWIELPYNPYDNKNYLDASGSYVNYLQLKNHVFVPQFGMKEDKLALNTLKQAFKDSEIIPVDCNELAIHGGILNCISWNVKK